MCVCVCVYIYIYIYMKKIFGLVTIASYIRISCYWRLLYIYTLKICCGGGLLFSNVVVSVKFEFSMKNYNKKVPSDFFFDLKNPRKAPSKFLTPQTKQIRSFRSATPVRPYYPVSLRSKHRIRIWWLRTKASSLHSYLRLAVIVFND